MNMQTPNVKIIITFTSFNSLPAITKETFLKYNAPKPTNVPTENTANATARGTSRSSL